MMHVRLRDRRPTASPIVPVLLVLCLVCMGVPSKTVVLSGQGPSQTAHLKIMALGDSITWGLKDPDYGGYRHLLGTLLANDGYSFEFVGSMQSGTGVTPSANNEGHSGWAIQQIQKGIDAQGWLETYRPDVILLHIGTNDLRPRVICDSGTKEPTIHKEGCPETELTSPGRRYSASSRPWLRFENPKIILAGEQL